MTNSGFTESYIDQLSSVIHVCQWLSSISYQLISWWADTAPRRPYVGPPQDQWSSDVMGTYTNVSTRWRGTRCIDFGPTSSYLLGFSIQVQVWGLLQTARLTFRTLCVMVKLSKKNYTFDIAWQLTRHSHINISLLSSAVACFCEEKWGIYFGYLCNSRFVQCYLYNSAKFGTICCKIGDCSELQNLANCAMEFVKICCRKLWALYIRYEIWWLLGIHVCCVCVVQLCCIILLSTNCIWYTMILSVL